MYIFIVNPRAGNGRAKRAFAKIRKSKSYNRVESIHYVTAYSGHAETIASRIMKEHNEEIDCIIVVGGDGTIHEVMNGFSCNDIPVAFIPGGSGNDFARGCGMKGSPVKIFEQILEGRYRIPYWLGEYQKNNEKKRFFVNSMGFGFDAEIALVANRSRYKKALSFLHLGTVSYVIALVLVLFTFKPMTMELVLNGNKRILQNCWMVTIANHPYYGGGMKIIPGAKIEPAVFPVLLIHSISKWKVLAVFLTVFTGKHIQFKEVELAIANQLKIHSKKKIPYQVDGQTDFCNSCAISKQNKSFHVFGKTIGSASFSENNAMI